MTTLPEISSTERFDVVTANENFQSTSPAAAFGIDWEETVNLTLGVLGGIAPDGTEKSDTTVALTGSQTNYVEMTTAGVVSSNTSAYTAGRVKLFRIVTNANGITSYTDDRSYSPGGLSVLGPTSSTDNAVARWDSTTGKVLQNSVVTISDTGAVAGATALTIASGTLTDPANALTITQTWNDAADTFVGQSIDITDTNSATASLPLRIQVGGATKFSVRKDGFVTSGSLGVNAAISANNSLNVSGSGTSTAASQTAINLNIVFTTSGTTGLAGMLSTITAPDGGGITYSSVNHFRAGTLVKSGAGDTITEFAAFRADANTAAALNIAFKGSMAVSGTSRYNLYMSGTAPNFLQGPTGIGVAESLTTNLIVAAGTTGVSSLRIPHGAAPSSPVNGDVWTTTSGIFVRINGATVGPLT